MPSSNYPTSLDTTSTQVTPGSTTDLDASGFEHDQVHGAASTALIALETKLGISASPAASASTNALLTHTGTGTTAWSTTLTSPTIAGATLSGAVVGAISLCLRLSIRITPKRCTPVGAQAPQLLLTKLTAIPKRGQ